jgi:hypothetical protein
MYGYVEYLALEEIVKMINQWLRKRAEAQTKPALFRRLAAKVAAPRGRGQAMSAMERSPALAEGFSSDAPC